MTIIFYLLYIIFIPTKNTNDDFKIKYFISEMLDTSSSVIQYGESMLCGEDEICHSRNNRIDDILN